MHCEYLLNVETKYLKVKKKHVFVVHINIFIYINIHVFKSGDTYNPYKDKLFSSKKKSYTYIYIPLKL